LETHGEHHDGEHGHRAHAHDEAHGEHGHGGHDAAHGQDHGHEDNWADEQWVADWVARQQANAPQRRQLFARVRALIPRSPDQPLRYANLGAGAGDLDELILERFPLAEAVLVDSSFPMLAHARRRLDRFEERVEYVQADLSLPSWTGGASGPFNAVVATRALHHVGGADRIRALFAEIQGMLGHGGVFVNLDYVRLARPIFQEMGSWATKDPDAGFGGSSPHMALPSSVEEQLGWLREAGFAAAECVYREFQTAILVGVHDHIHWPNEHEAHDQGAHHH
jgi:tRNA (cmo5U34)-methyltransferase